MIPFYIISYAFISEVLMVTRYSQWISYKDKHLPVTSDDWRHMRQMVG